MKRNLARIFFLLTGLIASFTILLCLQEPYDVWLGFPLGFFTIFFLFLPRLTQTKKSWKDKNK